MKTKAISKTTLAAIPLGLGALIASPHAAAQNANAQGPIEEVIVTGTRISRPGIISSSPVNSISEDEIDFHIEPEVEKILRILPSTIPGDGGNVNNGTQGAATVDLRGLGPERTLVLTNGKRMVPYNFDGEVDVSTVPTALVQRIDVVTGGASAVYGSDAIAGAVNVILKRNFEGIEIGTSRSRTSENDGETNDISITLGSNLADDRGNVALSLNWMDREGVLLGQRRLGTLGIDTETGANYQEYLNGEPPAAPPAGCGGPDVAASGGSTTAIPTRFQILGVGPSAGQFREDGTIGSECSVFNFNPYNFYQTPMERYSATALGHFAVTDQIEAYSRITFTNTTVVQQVAPSGTFGQSFEIPLANPFIGAQARQYMIDAATAGLNQGSLVAGQNWRDVNNNGVVDIDDYLSVQLRRRTVELGPRSENFDSDQWQMVFGFRGEFIEDWNYDAFFQYGESNRTTVRAGYTNLTNIQNALDTTDGVTCANGDPTCVPINLFGGFGTITEDMVGYAQAIAIQQQKYEQTVAGIAFDGLVQPIRLPSADNPLAVSFGFETREEMGSLDPDECLKLAPASCQGGAGGNLLPISGGYKADEYFFEGILPLIDGHSFAESLAVEFGFRWSDYDVTGSDETWKLGLAWRPTDQLLFRAMQQQAIRAPNVGEIASPVITGLDNAKQDPCSVANAANIDQRLRDLCISTGMTAAQVGTVQNVISGQVATYEGTDLAALPKPEIADTFTLGFVWTPDFDFVENLNLTVDYYEIEVEDVISEYSAQEILDSCYVSGTASECAKIRRIFGDLTISGAGVELFTTNLDYEKAEGIEVFFSFDIGLNEWGTLGFSGTINKYLTQESLSNSLFPVLDCKGYYGTSCDPLSELRWVQRTTWSWNDFAVSLLWRHIDGVDVEPGEAAGVYPEFRSIDDYDYFDLYASYTYRDTLEFSVGIDNLFDEDPPVLGNEVGDTSSNSGNTFPSNYATLGRILTFGVNLRF